MSELSFGWDESWDEHEYGWPYGEQDPYLSRIADVVAEASEASFFLQEMADAVEIDDAHRVTWLEPILSARIGSAGLFIASQYLELARMQLDDPNLGPDGHVCLLAPKPAPIDARRWPALPKSSVRKRNRVVAGRRSVCVALLRGWADYLDAAIVTLTSSIDHKGADEAAEWIRGLFDEADAQSTSIVSLWMSSRG